MDQETRWCRGIALNAIVIAACLGSAGCKSAQIDPALCASEIPRELTKVALPDYVIEPPDILLIDAISLVPLSPYKIQPLDALLITLPSIVPGSEPGTTPIIVDADGTVNLGDYGTITVVGMTLEQARDAIKELVKKRVKDKDPQVNVGIAQSRAMQQIRGDHLVRPDGTIGLGTYGNVRVVGMTLQEARAAVESHLSRFLQTPQISLDVYAFNSKAYYVIFDMGGLGQQMLRFPVTGNDTVLDAIGLANGLPVVSSKYHMWVARPVPACSDCDQVMPVDWVGITTRGRTETNYQLLPGDRLYVKADCMAEFDTRLARVLAPFERVFGFTLLGSGTVFSIMRNTAAGKFDKSTIGGSGGGSGGGF
jgi:polysaccharide export outer membrane protein